MKNKMIDEQIKEKSKRLFFSCGIRSISMDDVARECGISKKSIYQYFDDKNALLCAIVDEVVQSHKQLLKTCRLTSKDAIDEVIKQSGEPFEIWANIRPVFFYELEKSFPKAWHALNLYRSNMRDGIIRNLEWGKQEALYRADVNSTFTAEVWLHQVINFLQRRFVTTQKWCVHQSVTEFTKLHLHSITSEKGKQKIQTYFSQ